MLGTEKQWRSIYYFYGVGMPVLFLIILLAADNIPGNHIKPHMAETKCWFEGKPVKQFKNVANAIVCRKKGDVFVLLWANRYNFKRKYDSVCVDQYHIVEENPP